MATKNKIVKSNFPNPIKNPNIIKAKNRMIINMIPIFIIFND